MTNYRLKVQELIDQMISNREYLNDKDIQLATSKFKDYYQVSLREEIDNN